MQSNNLYYPSGAIYADISSNAHRYFYENGSPKTIELYEGGRLHGKVSLYWSNGILKRESQFHEGARQGFDRIWSEGGQLVDEGCYEHGKPVGIHRRWNLKGNLIEEICYLDPARFDCRQWDEVGQLRFEGVWIDKNYSEKTWDKVQKEWVEKRGCWDGKKLVYV